MAVNSAKSMFTGEMQYYNDWIVYMCESSVFLTQIGYHVIKSNRVSQVFSSLTSDIMLSSQIRIALVHIIQIVLFMISRECFTSFHETATRKETPTVRRNVATQTGCDVSTTAVTTKSRKRKQAAPEEMGLRRSPRKHAKT
jgi:hypothetical protein